jgi:hypothetical protein
MQLKSVFAKLEKKEISHRDSTQNYLWGMKSLHWSLGSNYAYWECTESSLFCILDSQAQEHVPFRFTNFHARFEYVMPTYHALQTSNEIAWMIWPKELRLPRT